MGNIICLRSKKRAVDNTELLAPSGAPVPVPRIWCQKNPKELALRPRDTLQDLCIAAVASAWHSLPASVFEAMPADLVQRVFDELVATRGLSLGDLTRFKELDLDTVVLVGCPDVRDEWLRHLNPCPRLRSLDLTGCLQVGDCGLAYLRRHCGLRHLKLNQCVAISDLALEHVGVLTGLVELELHGCDLLTGEGLLQLSGLTCLKRLDLDMCRRVKGGLQHLSTLCHLHTLHLGWCSFITDMEASWLRNLSELRELRLSYTKVGDEGVSHLSALTKLTHLDLAGCSRLTDSSASSLQRLSNLQILSLHCCSEIGNASLAALIAAPLQVLASLTLSYTAVTTAGCSGVSALSSLTHLSLDSCDVGDAACRALRKLPRLASLDLSETSVGDVGLDALTVPLTPTRSTFAASTRFASHLAASSGSADRYAALRAQPGPSTLPNRPHSQHQHHRTTHPHSNPHVALHSRRGVGARSVALQGGVSALVGVSAAAVGEGAVSSAASVTSLPAAEANPMDQAIPWSGRGAEAHTPGAPTSLTHLKLTYTKVTDEGLSKLALLVGLKQLDLDSGTLSDAGLHHVAALSALTALDLFSCRITDAGLLTLAGGPTVHGLGCRLRLVNLRSLECCGGLVTDMGAAHLGRLTALTSLNLSQNSRLGDAGVGCLAAALTDLQLLSLNHTGISSGCLKDLAALPWLRSLSVCNTRVTQTAVGRLKARAHPELIVKHSAVQ